MNRAAAAPLWQRERHQRIAELCADLPVTACGDHHELLAVGPQAMPMTYRLRPNGKQFVVIAAGGHGKIGTKLGDSLVAFALP